MITITFNECEDRPMPLYESETKKEDLLSQCKSLCQLHKQMLQLMLTFKKFVKSTMFYIS